MPASIEIHEMSGANSGVDKTTDTIRFKAADNSIVDNNDPLVIPVSGTVYSYTKKIRAYMETPPSVSITNLRLYTDGTGFGSYIDVLVRNLGTTWVDNYNTEMPSGSSLFDYTIVSPLNFDVTDVGPFVPADDNTYIGDIIELQMTITYQATQGALTPETLTFSYDEV